MPDTSNNNDLLKFSLRAFSGSDIEKLDTGDSGF